MRDRLDWAKTERVLFVLPDPDAGSDLLTQETELALLARHADGRRVQLGLITSDPAVRIKANALGFPTFLTLDLAETSGREWRKHRVRPDGSGYSRPELEDAYESVALRRMAELEESNRPEWQNWVKQSVFMLLGATCLTFLIAGIGFVTPSATVTLTPAREKITVQREVTAGIYPADGAQINGRASSILVNWQSELVPTGQAELGANAARGKIVFANLTGSAVVIPAGVRLGTNGDPSVEFQTIAPAELPSAVGGTIEVDILALDVGPQGNLPAGSILNIEGDWPNLIEVRQPLPTSGGDIQPVPVVTEADHLTLRTEVIQQLQSLAGSEIEATLSSNEFLSAESLTINQIISEEWSHAIGEKSERLTLTVQAEIGGIVVDLSQATDVVYTDLVSAVRPGFSLTPDSFRFYKAGTTRFDEQGRVVFEMVGEGTMTAVSDTAAVLEQIAGKSESETIEILRTELNLEGEPVIRIIPNWFGRMPNLPDRIEIIENE
ncbi:MAG: baseplate J/gp47 family protein [Anaerolineae bacterium]